MQQEMLLRDEETMELRETYTSLQQEVEIKTKKLKKVRAWQVGTNVPLATRAPGLAAAPKLGLRGCSSPPALCQAAGREGRDPGPARRVHPCAPGPGGGTKRADTGAEAQVGGCVSPSTVLWGAEDRAGVHGWRER